MQKTTTKGKKNNGWTKRNGYLIKKTNLTGIYKCKRGGYFIRKRTTDPRTGKQAETDRYVDVATEKDAYLIQQEWVERVRRGTTPEKPRQRFSDYAVSLLERKIAKGVIRSQSNIDNMTSCLERYLIPVFGDMYMDAITKQDIEDWLMSQGEEVNAGRYSPHSANTRFSKLRSIINAAYADLDLPRNPVAGVKPLDTSAHQGHSEEDPNALRPEHLQPFLDWIFEHYPQHYAMTLLGFCTGLRPSSLRPLRRKGKTPDILWDEGAILIRRSQTRGEPMNKTKTGRKQTLCLPKEVMDVLSWHVERLAPGAQEKSDLLFPSSRGGGFRSNGVLKKPFEAASKALGLGYKVTAKGMRRTLQDMARHAKVPDTVLRSISGHATPAMTRLYSTVHGDEQRQAMESMMELAKRSKKKADTESKNDSTDAEERRQ